MTRIGKQQERRHRYPHKRKAPAIKTGSKKDNLEKGYKEHVNALGNEEKVFFIPKIK
jgi:hypothetical protein